MKRRNILLFVICCFFVVFYIAVWHEHVQRTNISHEIKERYMINEYLNIMEEILLRRKEAINFSQNTTRNYEMRTEEETFETKMIGPNTKSVSTVEVNYGNSSMGILKTNKKKRKLIFILTQGRSGSSLLGDLFNRDEKAFYIYEPFRAIEKFNKFYVFVTENKTNLEFFEKEAASFLKGLATCVPNKVFDKYMNEYDEVGTRSRTALFATEPFQNVRVNSHLTSSLCSKNTTYTVIKELELRMPKKIENLVNISQSLGLDLRLIHLVRDPRAALFSQMKLDWFFEETNVTNRRLDVYVKNRCGETLNILKELKANENFRGKMEYILLRYEDIIDRPYENLRKITNFTGINVYKASKDWLTQMISGTGIGHYNRYIEGARNASAVKVAWESQISKKLRDEIERSCAELMQKLKYNTI